MKAGTTIAFEGDTEYNDLAGTAIQVSIGLFQPIGEKMTHRADLHQRLWVAGFDTPREFTLGLNLGLAYRLKG